MADPSERLYALAERLLDVQERDVTNLRARVPGVAAAAAVAATLLAAPATDGRHPDGLLEGLAFGAGTGGVVAVVVGLVGVLWSRQLVFAVSPRTIAAEAQDSGLADDPAEFDMALVDTLETIAASNAVTLRKVHRWSAVTLIGLAVEVAGFGLTAGVAS